MLSMFVSETQTCVDSLREKTACTAGGELPSAEVLVEVDKEAHTLKGSALTMGIQSIVDATISMRGGITAADPQAVRRSMDELSSAWDAVKPVLEELVALMTRQSELELC